MNMQAERNGRAVRQKNIAWTKTANDDDDDAVDYNRIRPLWPSRDDTILPLQNRQLMLIDAKSVRAEGVTTTIRTYCTYPESFAKKSAPRLWMDNAIVKMGGLGIGAHNRHRRNRDLAMLPYKFHKSIGGLALEAAKATTAELWSRPACNTQHPPHVPFSARLFIFFFVALLPRRRTMKHWNGPRGSPLGCESSHFLTETVQMYRLIMLMQRCLA